MTDEPTFTVHLPLEIKGAETPEEAVEAFIDQIASFGLRTWTYVVTSEQEGKGPTQVAVRPWGEAQEEAGHATATTEDGTERPAAEGEGGDDRTEGDGAGETEGGQEAGTPSEPSEG